MAEVFANAVSYIGPGQVLPENRPDPQPLSPPVGGADGPQWQPQRTKGEPRVERFETNITGSETAGTAIFSKTPIGLRARSACVYNTSNHRLRISNTGKYVPPGAYEFWIRFEPAIEEIDLVVDVAATGAGYVSLVFSERNIPPGGPLTPNGGAGTGLTIGGPLGSSTAAASVAVVQATPQNNAAARASVPNSATQVGATHATRANMLVKNTDASLTIDVGFSNAVTSGGGFPLKPGESASFSGPQVWAIASAAGPVSVAYFDSWF